MPTFRTFPTRPSNEPQYRRWLKVQHGVNLADQRARYQSLTSAMAAEMYANRFWRDLEQKLGSAERDYFSEHAAGLLTYDRAPELELKSFDSLINKTFRLNVLENDRWPSSPRGGWLTPDRWLEQVKDVVRTTILVRFLDGVPFLLRELTDMASNLKLRKLS